MHNILKILLISITLYGCSSPDPLPMQETGRSILIYMAADNNLYQYAETNIESMVKSAKKGDFGNNRLIIYLDAPGSMPPKLIEISAESNGQKVIKQYPSEQNSASKETLANAISDFKALAPAKEYGLILWSHASGWMFQNVNIKGGFQSTERVTDPFGIELEDEYIKYPFTKSFAIASFEGETHGIDIPDLALALPDNGFDFIIFDCCYMGSVEVVYELRNKAKYIIGSPTEIIATGMPYDKFLSYLFKPTLDLESVCKVYYDFYNEHPYPINRYATIALIKCSELESLSNSVSDIVNKHTAEINSIDPGKMQCFDRYYNHFIYDLGQFVRTIATDDEFKAFNDILANTIIVKYNTSQFISFNITEFSGLSSYIPGKLKYNGANALYYTTAWGAKYSNK